MCDPILDAHYPFAFVASLLGRLRLRIFNLLFGVWEDLVNSTQGFLLRRNLRTPKKNSKCLSSSIPLVREPDHFRFPLFKSRRGGESSPSGGGTSVGGFPFLLNQVACCSLVLPSWTFTALSSFSSFLVVAPRSHVNDLSLIFLGRERLPDCSSHPASAFLLVPRRLYSSMCPTFSIPPRLPPSSSPSQQAGPLSRLRRSSSIVILRKGVTCEASLSSGYASVELPPSFSRSVEGLPAALSLQAFEDEK